MKIKFALWLAAIAAILLAFDTVLGFIFWSAMNAGEREVATRILLDHTEIIVLLGVLALSGLGFLLKMVFDAYVLTPKWIADETRIILGANPSHRIEPAGAAELREICEAINRLAELYDSERREVNEKVAQARTDVEDEKNRLAALMAQLGLSVVVCNVDGKIILYNNAAKALLGQAGWIGLNRSIFAVLDRALIAHALEDVRHRLGEGDEQPVVNLISSRESGQLLRINVSPVLSSVEGPVLDREKDITGLVLTCEDVTTRMETSSRRDALLRSVTESTRAALANIRAAVETMLEYPEMKLDRRAQFTGIIADEARKLSGQLDRTLGESSDYVKAKVPLDSVPAADLLSMMARRIESRLGIKAEVAGGDRDLWLKVDSYALAQSACFLARRLLDRHGVRRIILRMRRNDRLANLDLEWAGPALDSDAVAAWENESLKEGGEEALSTLKQTLDRHDAEFLHRHESGQSLFRIILPIGEAASPARQGAYESRPEYYDFDLFNRSASRHDERRLSELTYTVFDTETTGLEPSAGDEIISIGAVRIVNNRVLQNEVFDQLIDPKRAISRKSSAVHGITREMLRDAPAIGNVLPRFFHFCEDTVLVAHNAAFDMRFLQLKEEATGIKFTHPVLDTLLLSPVVHPFDPEHRLEAMAQRLGISVMGRHTALGDAFLTAEVFLRMIPVLAQKGIHTLKQAQEASQKTQYAKVTY